MFGDHHPLESIESDDHSIPRIDVWCLHKDEVDRGVRIIHTLFHISVDHLAQ